MSRFLSYIEIYARNFFGSPTINDFVDILIVAVVIYNILKYTQKTRGSQVIKGFAIIFVALWLSEQFKLQMISKLLGGAFANAFVIVVILFQPEIRRILEQLGRRAGIERKKVGGESQTVIENITEAMVQLSKRKVGALLVIERKTGLSDISQSGTPMDSMISSGLLINIFEPNTPLHDGAIIIHETRIIAAGCVLPLTDNRMLSQELGTRHRAGLGVTETTDAVSLIVSEETGTISMAKGGRLTRYLDAEALLRILGEIYDPGREINPFLAFFRKKVD